MKTISIVTASCLLLGWLPAAGYADNPATYIRDRTEALFSPADEDEAIALLQQTGGSAWRRDTELLGAPIVGVSLGENQPDDEVLRALQRLPRMRSLVATSITRVHLKALTKLRQVEKLIIVATELGRAEIVALGEMPRLLDLTVFRCPIIEEEALQEIGQLPRLRSLKLVNCTGVTDKSIKGLSRLTYLSDLRLNVTPITDESVTELVLLPNLRRLELDGTAITNAGLEKLARSKSLSELSICHTKVNDDGIKCLARLKGLHELHLTGTRVTDAAMATLTHLPDLRALNLNRTAITNAGLEQLARSKSLSRLWLSVKAVDDDGVVSLAQLSTLRFLNVENCDKLTAEGIRRLKVALPDCEIIWQEDAK
jgi:Leucine Rich repeat